MTSVCIDDVLNLNYSDVQKNHYCRADLEKISAVYRACCFSSAKNEDLYKKKFSMIIEAASKQIDDFAKGLVTVSDDAFDLMQNFLEEFGRGYVVKNNKLTYAYTKSAAKSKILLRKQIYNRKEHIENTNFSAQAKTAEISKDNFSFLVDYFERKNQKTLLDAEPKVSALQNKVKVLVYTQSLEAQKMKELFLKNFHYCVAVAENSLKSYVQSQRLEAERKSVLLQQKIDNLKIYQNQLSKKTVCYLHKQQEKASRLQKLFFEKVKNVANGFCETAQNKVAHKVRHYGMSLIASYSLAGTAALGAAISYSNDVTTFSAPSDALGDAKVVNVHSQSSSAAEDLKACDISFWETTLADNQNKSKNAWNRFVPDTLRKEQKDSVGGEKLVPYDYDYLMIAAKNSKDYQSFIGTLVGQFNENISKLNSSKVNKNLFYKQQEDIIGKYGKSRYINRKLYCESLSFTTFITALEKSQNEDNHVAQACKDLLLETPNPHLCYANTRTFNASYTRNLRKSMEQELREDKPGIYMIWLRNHRGLHRQTIVSTGDGKAYLFSYNNNKIVKMSVDALKKVTSGSGYWVDFGEKIYNQANEEAFQEVRDENSFDLKKYFEKQAQDKLLSFSRFSSLGMRGMI